MGYRVNERNIGNYSIDGNMKSRRTAKQPLNAAEKSAAKLTLLRVYECMEREEDGKYRDGGRFLLELSKGDWERLLDVIEKL